MNKISRRGFFAIPVTSATTAIVASAAMAQPVVRTQLTQVLVSGAICKCGTHMMAAYPHWDEYAFDVPVESQFCCNSKCDLFHVPFEMPKIEVTEVRPVRYNR